MPAGLISALFSGMWHGYRRWMTLFNSLSIVLSVTLAMVILGFTHGVRQYVEEMVRKEAAAGAVRINAGGWQTGSEELSFAQRVTHADRRLKDQGADTYLGFNFWWRSEAHYLMPDHPADNDLGGVFVKMGNTYPADPEAARVAPFAVKGRWVSGLAAPEIVLGSAAAVKLAKRIEEVTSVEELVGREVWITLPPTREHLAAACAQVEVVGIFDHLRDGACMTTPGVIQEMHARTQANAYGKWYETYDRIAYEVRSVGPPFLDLASRLAEAGPVPLICWRSRDDAGRWISLRGAVVQRGEDGATKALRNEAARMQAELDAVESDRPEKERALEGISLRLQGSDETVQWLEELDTTARAALAEGASPDAVERFQVMTTVAIDQLDLDMEASSIISSDAYAFFHAALTGEIASIARGLQEEAQRLESELAEVATQASSLARQRDALLRKADGAARTSILPRGHIDLEVATVGADLTLHASGELLEELPVSERSRVETLDQRHPDGYALCAPRIWDELGFAAAPHLPVDDWRTHALYAYLYFDGLQPALTAREQLKQWGFDTYMPIDRFKGLLALVQVVTWAAVALLAAVLLAGLLGIVVTLYTEVDAEEAEIGLLKALGASNRLIGLVFLGKGAMVGLIGVAVGVPLAWAVTGRINSGVSGAVARAAGLTDVETGLFSQDPAMVWATGAAIVGLAALAALMPALQAAGKDPQEALRAE